MRGKGLNRRRLVGPAQNNAAPLAGGWLLHILPTVTSTNDQADGFTVRCNAAVQSSICVFDLRPLRLISKQTHTACRIIDRLQVDSNDSNVNLSQVARSAVGTGNEGSAAPWRAGSEQDDDTSFWLCARHTN